MSSPDDIGAIDRLAVNIFSRAIRRFMSPMSLKKDNRARNKI
jgi:hypothetical protein